jgi:hypothetical protein
LIVFPPKLIKAINDNKLIIWIGSGYSLSLGFPKWNGFIKRLAELAFENNEVRLSEFLKMVDENQKTELKNQLSPIEILEQLAPYKNKIFNSLTDIFRLPDLEDSDLAWLPFQRIWAITNKVITTNYDLALDENKPHSIDKVVYHNKYQLKYLLESDKFLFKLHGCIQADPEKCVVFKDQYEGIYSAVASKIDIDLTTEHEARFLLKTLLPIIQYCLLVMVLPVMQT